MRRVSGAVGKEVSLDLVLPGFGSRLRVTLIVLLVFPLHEGLRG